MRKVTAFYRNVQISLIFCADAIFVDFYILCTLYTIKALGCATEGFYSYRQLYGCRLVLLSD